MYIIKDRYLFFNNFLIVNVRKKLKISLTWIMTYDDHDFNHIKFVIIWFLIIIICIFLKTNNAN